MPTLGIPTKSLSNQSVPAFNTTPRGVQDPGRYWLEAKEPQHHTRVQQWNGEDSDAHQWVPTQQHRAEAIAHQEQRPRCEQNPLPSEKGDLKLVEEPSVAYGANRQWGAASWRCLSRQKTNTTVPVGFKQARTNPFLPSWETKAWEASSLIHVRFARQLNMTNDILLEHAADTPWETWRPHQAQHPGSMGNWRCPREMTHGQVWRRY